ncbi:Sin3 associated polypeptide p18-domain-containing protein [Leucosporidium creatinivorum]|uniref:Sin3 associated polypeptide p18-domain-containing protein n=1 Tax=Leucosporidium creatinivorum TaxID=106004 RepID=A0A1Y2FBA6_9BASI|nr:Sin3 associated polypeptide p18-domain-containing protein [Leucosporidium creatinivorum]
MSRPAPPYGAPPPPPRSIRVDRDKVTPSLLRVFVNHGIHHDDSQFTPLQQPTNHEYQLYAWRDTTVRELLLLLRDTAPTLRSSPQARYSLRLIFYDPQLARFTSRDLANLSARDLLPLAQGGTQGRGAERTLDDVRYVVGDFVDVAYIGPPAMGGGVGVGIGQRDGYGAAAGGGGPPPPTGPGGRYGPPPHLGPSGPSAFNANRGFGAGPPPPSGPRGGGVGYSAPGPGGGMMGRGGFAGPSAAREAWGPAPGGGGGGMERRRDGPALGAGGAGGAGGGGWGARGAGGMDSRRGPPADNGWGRRGGEGGGGRDDRLPPRRRDSRSRSPVRRERTRSPPPPPRD